MTSFRYLSASGALVLALAAALPAAAGLQPEREPALPADTAVLDLLLPAGATVSIDGEDRGSRRRFVYRRLSAQTPREHEVHVQFAGGSEARRTVLLQGGLHVRLPLLPPLPPPEPAVKTAAVRSVAFAPDGQRLLVGLEGDRFVLWDLVGGKPLRTVPGKAGAAAEVVFSPDGRWTLAGVGRKTAALLDAGTGRKVRSFPGHAQAIRAAAFSPDGKRLLTGSEDKMAILWEAATGRQLCTFPAGAGAVLAVAFSPDGRQALTGSADGAVRLWDLATGDELARLLGFGDEWLVLSPEGLLDGPAAVRQKVRYRVGDGAAPPAGRSAADLHRPGLLAALRRGERPMPGGDPTAARPPIVTIVQPRQGGEAPLGATTLEVEVSDEGGGVRGPWLYHNGARVLTPGGSAATVGLVRRQFTVHLVEGANQLEVRAASADGALEGTPARLVLSCARRAERPDLYLLSVGVNRYRQESLNLQYAVGDARAMTELFQQRGKPLYRTIQATTLVDDGATRAAIRQALGEAARRARPQDVLVVFLAGYGRKVGQRAYFIPHEFRFRDGKTVEEDIREQGLALDVLGDDLRAVAAGRRLVILDCGYCGKGIDWLAAREGKGGTARTFVIANEEEAVELKEMRHGALTAALLAGLEGGAGVHPGGDPAPPRRADGTVTVGGWLRFAREHLPRLTGRQEGRKLNAAVRSQGEDFPILANEDRR
jgi:uncharacterized caspase-like protein